MRHPSTQDRLPEPKHSYSRGIGAGERASLQESTAEEGGHALSEPKESSWLTGNCRQTGAGPPLTR